MGLLLTQLCLLALGLANLGLAHLSPAQAIDLAAHQGMITLVVGQRRQLLSDLAQLLLHVGGIVAVSEATFKVRSLFG